MENYRFSKSIKNLWIRATTIKVSSLVRQQQQQPSNCAARTMARQKGRPRRLREADEENSLYTQILNNLWKVEFVGSLWILDKLLDVGFSIRLRSRGTIWESFDWRLNHLNASTTLKENHTIVHISIDDDHTVKYYDVTHTKRVRS